MCTGTVRYLEGRTTYCRRAWPRFSSVAASGGFLNLELSSRIFGTALHVFVLPSLLRHFFDFFLVPLYYILSHCILSRFFFYFGVLRFLFCVKVGHIVSVGRPFPLPLLQFCITSCTVIRFRANAKWQIDTVFYIHIFIKATVLCKISTNLNAPIFKDINVLYDLVANRSGAEFVIGAQSIITFCRAYNGSGAMHTFVSWVTLHRRCDGFIRFSVSWTFVHLFVPIGPVVHGEV